jgi:hypothetical protein
MKQLLAAMIAAALATGVAFAQEKKAEEKKPTAAPCQKDPKIKGCDELTKEAAKTEAAPAAKK